jgi:hypothetical protein
MPRLIRDAQLISTVALPEDDTPVYSAVFDLGHGAKGTWMGDFDLRIQCDALTSTQVADTDAIVYSVQDCDEPTFSSPRVILPGVITQLGVSTDGAAAVDKRFGLPSDVQRYVRVEAQHSESDTDASAKNFETSLEH